MAATQSSWAWPARPSPACEFVWGGRGAGRRQSRRKHALSHRAVAFARPLDLPPSSPPPLRHRVYTNAVTKAARPLVGDEIDAAGEFLGVSLRRPIDR